MNDNPDRSDSPDREKMELSHDPVPGFKPVFFLVLVAAVAWLVWIFVQGGHWIEGHH